MKIFVGLNWEPSTFIYFGVAISISVSPVSCLVSLRKYNNLETVHNTGALLILTPRSQYSMVIYVVNLLFLNGKTFCVLQTIT